ncbi:MAG: phosphopentomutase [Pseudomonadota bacterium]
MPRAFLVVMDSVGVGGAPDADQFFNGSVPDTGANTLAHIAEACALGAASCGRDGPLSLPTLDDMGLGRAVHLASGVVAPGMGREPKGLWGVATEQSRGKDTPSGHWELAGLPVPWDWHHFPDTIPAFPANIVREVCELADVGGILGNCHASGTAIIDAHGAEHIRLGWPICYTSADSVFQIATHEVHFGLDRLLELCAGLAPTLHAMKVGRVIARPFVGDPDDGFERTVNRRDYAIRPPHPVLTDWVQRAGGTVHAIGKIGDIFSMQGIDTLEKGTDAELMDHLKNRIRTAADGSLTFANFVEFDSLYGHRRDTSGYARALEWFDTELAQAIGLMQPGDMLLITADHGNDPTRRGTDHTRERVPVLITGKGTGQLGKISFSDVAGLVAEHLGIAVTVPTP